MRLVCPCVVTLAAGVLASAAAWGAVDDHRRSLEADWSAQARLRFAGASGAGAVKTSEDAAGGCDGVKDGKWGFHTDAPAQGAWWQVDLGQPLALSHALIYNRCDAASRAANLELWLSGDGRDFRRAYRHEGTVFFGFTDGKPLKIDLAGQEARFVRLRGPGGAYLHLDEVEVYGPGDAKRNLALGRPADQSGVSPWSTRKSKVTAGMTYPTAQVLDRGRRLAADLQEMRVPVDRFLRQADAIERDLKALPPDSPDAPDAPDQARAPHFRACAAVRALALANPLLDFDQILFVKRVPGSYSHMSDQYYSWWSRPGGGVFLLEGFKTDPPRLRCLTDKFPQGSFLAPDLSYDGKKVLFAYCRHYPDRAALRNKLDKAAQPEDAFYHVFEMNLDGTGLKQLTFGRYDDFHPRYLPSGQIVFLSTRRGQFTQCGKTSAMATTTQPAMPDSFVRCGGDAYRPVSIYTLHVMDGGGLSADGGLSGGLRAISAFESFEWDPSVAHDGRLLYARWDYVDRDNMPYMKLWATGPDGTNPVAVYGNFTRNPHCIFEARSIPGSRKLLCTASGHHAITGGSLVLLDPSLGVTDGELPLTRLTPEVCFPETEGWPGSYYTNPYPLSERHYLTAWSDQSIHSEGGANGANATGIYLFDAFGNLTLLHRDPAIASMYPLPVRARPRPPVLSSSVAWDGPQEGRLLIQNIYEGLADVSPGSVKAVRVVAMPVKTQPNMNSPNLGVTRDDPGKCVIGTAPVEKDGSAYFRVPSGVAVFFQALDDQGRAVQTMRSLTYVQPGQTLSCVGCHEPRQTAPAAQRPRPLAQARAPSKLTPGPDGSWPLRFDQLVQPVLDKHCVSCHKPGAPDVAGAKFDLASAGPAYDRLVAWGKPSLADHVRGAYRAGRSAPHAGAAQTSALLALLDKGHYDTKLDDDARGRLILWMDTYAQRLGAFSAAQEAALTDLRRRWAPMLEP